jgi:hypothetical protein
MDVNAMEIALEVQTWRRRRIVRQRWEELPLAEESVRSISDEMAVRKYRKARRSRERGLISETCFRPRSTARALRPRCPMGVAQEQGKQWAGYAEKHYGAEGGVNSGCVLHVPNGFRIVVDRLNRFTNMVYSALVSFIMLKPIPEHQSFDDV